MAAAEWDDSSKRLYSLARQESFSLGDEYIGTQHLLLAAVTVTPIEQHGIFGLNRDEVLAAIIESIGLRDPDSFLLSPGCQTPRAKLVLSFAMQRAERESRPVNCRDIWFGILADPESQCQKVFRHLKLDLENLRQRLT